MIDVLIQGGAMTEFSYQARTALLVRSGSQLYGTNISDTPDNDEMGIFVEPREVFFSTDSNVKRQTQVQYRSAGQDAQGQDNKSQAGDIDGQLYSLHAFMRETAKGNPNTITMLYAPNTHILRQSPFITNHLFRNRTRFISRSMGQRYLGYLKNQRKMYLTGPGADKHRFALVQAHGYDTKGAYHALRVAIQGIELMTDGRIQLPMAPINQVYLKRVRRGQFSKDEVLVHLARLESLLEEKIKDSVWPLQPDYRVLTQWNYELHELYWSYQDGLTAGRHASL